MNRRQFLKSAGALAVAQALPPLPSSPIAPMMIGRIDGFRFIESTPGAFMPALWSAELRRQLEKSTVLSNIGSDANIGLELRPKGSGTASIRVRKP